MATMRSLESLYIERCRKIAVSGDWDDLIETGRHLDLAGDRKREAFDLLRKAHQRITAAIKDEAKDD